VKEKDKIIVVLGQTSTGKSDFAVEISKKLALRGIKTEIISADSRQVYKGMDLGTGKITKKEMQGVSHHLLDVVSPKTIFSVNNFQKLARKKIYQLIAENKIPIICGGTGFYIDSIINEIHFPEVPPNNKLRKELEKKSAKELFSILKQIDINRASNIDPNNKVRIIRAIEIAKTLGKVPFLPPPTTITTTNFARAEFVVVYPAHFEVLKIGLALPSEILKERIKNRLLSRIKKGMIREVQNLHKKGLSWKRMYQLGLEYRYISIYLQNKLTKIEMIEKLNTEIWHFAKRQKTWFKRDPNITWIDPRKKKDKNTALKKINEFLK
jgi:tRNA dimethylallyltransferase